MQVHFGGWSATKGWGGAGAGMGPFQEPAATGDHFVVLTG